MTSSEGVVKYDLDFTPAPPSSEGIAELNAWRELVYRLDGIGRDPQRYGGFGFGNLSRRSPDRGFLITGTQTGGRAVLTEADYARVLVWEPEANRLVATGPCRPSAEALTHGTVYDADPAIAAVLHVHCPVLWRAARTWAWPATAADVAYGTPAMARATRTLLAEPETRRVRGFVMAGHADGVVTFGSSLEAACLAFVRALVRAWTSFPGGQAPTPRVE